MKFSTKLFITLFVILSSTPLFSLQPFWLQGTAIGNTGQLLVNQSNLTIRVTITDNGTTSYQEVFSAQPSNDFGTFSVHAGTGTPQSPYTSNDFTNFTASSLTIIRTEVAVGAGTYVVTMGCPVSTIATTNGAAWKDTPANIVVPEVVTFRGPYNSGTTYAQNDLVSSSTANVYFYSLTAGNNTGNTPETSPASWQSVRVEQLNTIRKTNVTLNSPGFTSLISVSGLTASNPTAGGRIQFTLYASDGGTQMATAQGIIQWNCTQNSITCTVQTDDVLHLGTVNPGSTPGFYNPSSQPGVAIFDNVSFSSPAAIVTHEVYFRLNTAAGLSYSGGVANPATIRLEY